MRFAVGLRIRLIVACIFIICQGYHPIETDVKARPHQRDATTILPSSEKKDDDAPKSNNSSLTLRGGLSRNSTCAAAARHVSSMAATQPDASGGGTPFLMDRGVILALSTYDGGDDDDVYEIDPLRNVRIRLYNCGSCREMRLCRVSFNARLLGTRAIFAASVVPDDGVLGDYRVEFASPPVPGHYRLELSVRWFRGHEFYANRFLGADGRENFRRTPEWEDRERSCAVFGSESLNVSVGATRETTAAADGKMGSFDRSNWRRGSDGTSRCEGLGNHPGYWERVENRSAFCSNASSHPGECFVLDDVNREWLWRGHDCRYEFLSPEDARACFSNTSLYVQGDSLTLEFYRNLVHYVPEINGQRVFWKNTRGQATDLDTMVPFDLNILNQIETPNLYILTNFNIAHLVRRHHLFDIYTTAAQSIRDGWDAFKGAAANTTTLKKFEVVFATGVPAHFEREKSITKYRMAQARDILTRVSEESGFSVFDTVPPLESRQDASWDGFHFLQVNERRGGAAKMLMMMLLNHLCLDEKGE